MQGYYENHRDGMEHSHAWYAHNDHFTPHFHHSIELVYVLSGQLKATLDGAEYTVGANTMLINSSYTVHGYETPTESDSIVAIIPLAQVPTARPLLSKKSFTSPLCPDDADGTLGMLMRMLVSCRENPLAARGICYTLLGLLVERVGLVEARPNRKTSFIRDVLEYVQQHHTEAISVAQLAAQFGYSRSRFSYLFHAHLGYTVSEYISALRCQHAAQLLRETDMAVSDVAMAVGFESLRTFYRTFKNQYDMTPNQYAQAIF